MACLLESLSIFLVVFASAFLLSLVQRQSKWRNTRSCPRYISENDGRRVILRNKNKIMKLKTTAITIKAGTSFELPLMVTKPNTTVHWVFHTKVYDIHFGIAKEGEGKERQYVVVNTAYPPDCPQQGKIVFEEAGEYFFIWDNTYSWIREKNVVYSIEIVLPEETLEEKVACSRYKLLVL